MTDWITDSFRAEFDKQAAALGRVNLGIFGKTGVGKSTLVNAIFGAEVARTGIGEPVTQGSHLYLDRRGHLGLLDTRGLEIGRDDKDLLKDLEKSIKEMRRRPLFEQIHAAWYCVRGMDRRFEAAEAAFIRKLDELDVPVILVFTQVPKNGDLFHPDAVTLAESIIAMDLPILGGRPFMTNAVRDQFTGQSVHGLTDVLDATFHAAPDAVASALNAAQTVDLARKGKEAQRVIAGASAAAVAAAASPIPFSDAAMLVPIQLGMMARIGQLYGIRFERAALAAIASTTAATQGGRAAFTGLLKFIPGAGTVAGGALSAGVASSLTFAMGQAWLAVCQRVARGGLRGVDGALDNTQLKDLFVEEFRKRMPRVRREADVLTTDDPPRPPEPNRAG
ncbi:MAG: DUF697 domain-containing protein [Propionibacterium sp.]|nr:DUF697 domain-containing protein [Propionibacterium sp.]